MTHQKMSRRVVAAAVALAMLTAVAPVEAEQVGLQAATHSQDQIFYEYTVSDPTLYTQPWRGESSLNATPDRIFEYACHEGNYAMVGILMGAREQEKRAER